jgi:hypothetical protein
MEQISIEMKEYANNYNVNSARNSWNLYGASISWNPEQISLEKE